MSSVATHVELHALSGLPLIEPGDDLGGLLIEALSEAGIRLRDGDILVVTQKIVSKAEGRYVDLESVQPSERAVELAEACKKDPRLVELVLRESEQLVRCVPDTLIVRHRLGLVCANAGIDRSNIDEADSRVLLLPEDPDRSAESIRRALEQAFGVSRIGVLIVDSFGRPWRLGTCGTCIGSAGIVALEDYRGRADMYGRPLEVTQVAQADELAAAASILMGPSDQKVPIVLVRGMSIAGAGTARDLVRPREEDLFLSGAR